MKFFLVPILMALLLTQTFSKWMVVLEYKLNKDFIAQNLCVNKAKPKLNCHGKCQMMKRLAEEEKQDPSNTANNSSKIKLPELVFSNEINKPIIPALTLSSISYNEKPNMLLPKAPAVAIFHPPSLG